MRAGWPSGSRGYILRKVIKTQNRQRSTRLRLSWTTLPEVFSFLLNIEQPNSFYFMPSRETLPCFPMRLNCIVNMLRSLTGRDVFFLLRAFLSVLNDTWVIIIYVDPANHLIYQNHHANLPVVT